MSIVSWKKDETVAIITMNNGENRHNPAFAKAMLVALEEVEKDTSVYSIILTSSDEKSWSQGIDVAWIFPAFTGKEFDSIKQFMYDMNKVFKAMLLMRSIGQFGPDASEPVLTLGRSYKSDFWSLLSF